MANNIPKYIKQKYCNSCGRKNIAIIPTEKNLKENALLSGETEVLICRNLNCKLFQNFSPDRWWRYKNID